VLASYRANKRAKNIAATAVVGVAANDVQNSGN
jgi:hypothetical protein